MKDQHDNQTGELMMDDITYKPDGIVLTGEAFDRLEEMVNAEPSEEQKEAIRRLLSRERRWDQSQGEE